MKVYWAGPLFSQAEQEFNQRSAKRLEKEGFEVYLPQRDTPQDLNSYDIFICDKRGVKWANAIVGVCDGSDVDSGTAWEIGYAYAIDRSIVTLRTDFRYFEDDMNGLRGKFNLMISQCATCVVESVEEIIEELKKLRIK